MEKHDSFSTANSSVILTKTFNVQVVGKGALAICQKESQFESNDSCQAGEFKQYYSNGNEIQIVINTYDPNGKMKSQSTMVGTCVKTDKTEFQNGNFVKILAFSPKASFSDVKLGMGEGCGSYLVESDSTCKQVCQSHFNTVCKPQGFVNWSCTSKNGPYECSYQSRFDQISPRS